jgi:hypothetical protein
MNVAELSLVQLDLRIRHTLGREWPAGALVDRSRALQWKTPDNMTTIEIGEATTAELVEIARTRGVETFFCRYVLRVKHADGSIDGTPFDSLDQIGDVFTAHGIEPKPAAPPLDPLSGSKPPTADEKQAEKRRAEIVEARKSRT